MACPFPKPQGEALPRDACVQPLIQHIHSYSQQVMLKQNSGSTFPIDVIFPCTNIPVTPTVPRATIKNTPCTSLVFCVKIHGWHNVTETYCDAYLRRGADLPPSLTQIDTMGYN